MTGTDLCVNKLVTVPVIFKPPYTYTGCNRRNGPDFGRVFLM